MNHLKLDFYCIDMEDTRFKNDTRFKPGALWTGNKNGRPKGSKSLKTYVKEMLQDMSDDEKLEFLEGIDKKVLWEMAEGKPDTKSEFKGDVDLTFKWANEQDNNDTVHAA